jgi:hypothetical protein
MAPHAVHALLLATHAVHASIKQPSRVYPKARVALYCFLAHTLLVVLYVHMGSAHWLAVAAAVAMVLLFGQTFHVHVTS